MARKWSDTIIVLRTWNVGEADRFAVVLTKKRGKCTVRAFNARIAGKRRQSSLLTLHRYDVVIEEHSYGMKIVESTDTTLWNTAMSSPYLLSYASELAEIIMKTVEDQTEIKEIFSIVEEYLLLFETHNPSDVTTMTIMKYLSILGCFPSIDRCSISGERIGEDMMICFHRESCGFCKKEYASSASSISKETSYILRKAKNETIHRVLQEQCIPEEIHAITKTILMHHYSTPLVSTGVRMSLSS